MLRVAGKRHARHAAHPTKDAKTPAAASPRHQESVTHGRRRACGVSRRCLIGRLPSSPESAAAASAGEVLRADLLQELPELLDLVLLLVGDDDPRLTENLVGATDRGTDPQRQGDRVAGARGDPQTVTDEQLRV